MGIWQKTFKERTQTHLKKKLCSLCHFAACYLKNRHQLIFFSRYDNPILVFPVFLSFSTPRKLSPNSLRSLGPLKPERRDILSSNDSASADTGIGEYFLKSSITGLNNSSSDHSVTHRPTARFGVTILNSSYRGVWSSNLKRESVILT